MRPYIAGCAVGLMSIIGAGVALAGEAGAYDGTYELAFSETYLLVNCVFSNFAGDLSVPSPRYVTLPDGSRVPETVIVELEDEALQYIQALGLEGFEARRAEAFADEFYDAFERSVNAELAIYPDWMWVTMSDPVDANPFLYLFDAALLDETSGWRTETVGAMGTYEGVFGLEPVLEYDYDVALDTTILGYLAARQMGGVVAVDEGALRWAARVVAVNTYTELILACSASGVAPFGIEPFVAVDPDPEATPVPEPEPTPTPESAATPVPGARATGPRVPGFGATLAGEEAIPSQLLPPAARTAVQAVEERLNAE